MAEEAAVSLKAADVRRAREALVAVLLESPRAAWKEAEAELVAEAARGGEGPVADGAAFARRLFLVYVAADALQWAEGRAAGERAAVREAFGGRLAPALVRSAACGANPANARMLRAAVEAAEPLVAEARALREALAEAELRGRGVDHLSAGEIADAWRGRGRRTLESLSDSQRRDADSGLSDEAAEALDRLEGELALI